MAHIMPAAHIWRGLCYVADHATHNSGWHTFLFYKGFAWIYRLRYHKMPVQTYTLVGKREASKINTKIMIAGDTALVTLPGKELGIYAVEHKPTGAIYVGSSRNLFQTHQSWYYRLAYIDSAPPLNWAFRAIYTKRSDFVFHVLATLPDDTLFATKCLEMENIVKQRILLKGKEFLLNCNNSTETREFWVGRTPLSERPYRFAKAASEARPVPIIPHEVPMGDGAIGLHPSHGGAIASTATNLADTQVRQLLQQEVETKPLVNTTNADGKVTLIPGRFQENALGSTLARVRHVEFLRREYGRIYSLKYEGDDNGVWSCWLSTSHIDHSLDRQVSTIKEMHSRTLEGNNGE